jgi:formimidoylglutamase
MIEQHEQNTEDLRLGEIIMSWDRKSDVDVGIVGVPYDYGVALSGGRIGAAKAPESIRQQLKKYGTVFNIARNTDLSKLKIADFGNVDISTENVHDNVTDMVTSALGVSGALIVLGGGNDISYASIRALSGTTNDDIGGANIDAHFDVRPIVKGRVSSGTPYRKLIDEGFITGQYFSEISIQGHVNFKSHRDWLIGKGANIVYLNEVKRYGANDIFDEFITKTEKCGSLFVSIDIDSVAQAFAPASSAPSPDGLFPEDILSFAFLAGTDPYVRLFEIMEVNPKYDIDNMTSRLAANIIHEFLSGYSRRKK